MSLVPCSVCGVQPVESTIYNKCRDCWWHGDPRNVKNGGTVDLEKYKMSEDMQDKNQKFLDSVGKKEMLPSNYLELDREMRKEEEKKGPQPGPKPAPISLNGRFIVETYKEDRALKATVSNGFAMVQQKVSVKGLTLLADVMNSDGQYIAHKGSKVYIREGNLQAAAWAKVSFTSEAIEGEFMIVEQQYIEFVERQ